MKWSKISKLAYSIFFSPFLPCQKQTQKSQPVTVANIQGAGTKLTQHRSNVTKAPAAPKGYCPTGTASKPARGQAGGAPAPSPALEGLWLTHSGTVITWP